MAAAATARRAAAAPSPARAPTRRTPTRRAPARRAPTLPKAASRTAGAVRGLPDCAPIVGLTRGRAWIPLLGVLLAGIVALNVLTLSFTATAGKIDTQITSLRQENSVLRAREARLLSNGRVSAAAAGLGLVRMSPDEIQYRHTGPAAVKAAAARLAAEG